MINSARLEIRQPMGVLQIDQTALRASCGIKTREQFIRDNAEAGQQAAMEFIAQTAQNGDRLARISSGENAIIGISADKMVEPTAEVVWAELAPPEISYTPSKVEIRVVGGNVDISV